jgi:hypothetical protein
MTRLILTKTRIPMVVLVKQRRDGSSRVINAYPARRRYLSAAIGAGAACRLNRRTPRAGAG